MTESLAQLSGALSGRYSIERELGEGGMATVYLAHDVKHNRKVAVKVLRPELAAVIGAERFLKEIEVTANLQHPNILPLYDSGRAGQRDGGTEFLYYVMPYIEGESLRDKLDREKQLAMGEAFEITRTVGGALDYAHRHGVIHRDVKPANILLHDEQALIADFGIALAVSQAGSTRLTETGLSIGTPHYMSPEQAMGDRALDARSDVYSLGAMLYEMLVGEPPFTGPTAQAIVAKVLTEKPTHVSVRRDTVPRHVDAAVDTALAKLPADRFASATEFVDALSRPSAFMRATDDESLPTSQAPAHQGRRPPGFRLGVLIGSVAAGVVLVLAWVGLRSPESSRAPVQFALTMGDVVPRSAIAISPDGRRLAQSVIDNNALRVVVRDLGSLSLTSIQGTDGGADPFFSPDGEWIVFRSGTTLRKVSESGGPPVDIADAIGNGGGWWGERDEIVYSKLRVGLNVVSADGGTPRQVTTTDSTRGEFAHWWPQFLPDDRAVVFTSYATPISESRIEVVELASGRRTVLVKGGVFGRYVDGYLLYARDGAVFALKFDPDALRVEGTAVPVVDDVAWEPSSGLAGYAVSPSGTLTYVRESVWNARHELVWVDRAGRVTPILERLGAYSMPRLAPDGNSILLTLRGLRRDLWLYELNRGLLRQVTQAPSAAFGAEWMPDGRRALYVNETPVYDIFEVVVDGSGPQQSVVVTENDKILGSLSADGAMMAYTVLGSLWLRTLDSDDPPRQLVDSGVVNGHASISPDGRWVAFTVGSLPPNVYVRASDRSGGRRQVSVDGGWSPQWTRAGRELVYRTEGAVMTVSVDLMTGEISRPAEVFRGDYLEARASKIQYDVSSDGSRFVMLRPVRDPGSLPVVVVTNWVEELKARMGN